MVKPTRTFLLLTYITLLLAGLLVLPEQIELGDLRLKIPRITALFAGTTPTQYADISKITEQFDKDKQQKNANANQDSTDKKSAGQAYIPDSLRLKPELRIQFPEDQDTLLYGFFRALESLKRQDTLVRVVHFGDSQLEGDRITAFLRERFQAQFGGSGVGISNVVDKLNSKASIGQTTRANWLQTQAYGPRYNRRAPNRYGILLDYYKLPVGDKWTKGSFSYLKSQYATPRQSRVERVKVLYRNADAPFELSVQVSGQAEAKEKIEPSDKFGVFYYDIPEGKFEQINIGVACANKSPEIYGVALDSKTGVTFDNVPLRGSSGVDFTGVDRAHLRQQFQKLNVKFVILQFGVNLVPNPMSDYGWYEKMFYEQLQYLKSLVPNLSILVVGVSDMSRNMTGQYESYPNIEKIRNAQRAAAFRAGCAFWDLYEAMGGKNSMPSWVFAKPVALATKDFTHFTPKGAEIVSEMLYKALMNEYYRYGQLFH